MDPRPEMTELAQRGGMERGRRHAPMPERREPAAISPAALSVNVTTSTSRGRTTPVASAYATRREMTRVLPLPAPARMHSGPEVIVTASRWAGSRSVRRSSGSGTGTRPS